MSINNNSGQIKTACNSVFAIGRVLYSADSFVVAENSILLINICGKKPAHRKSAKRYSEFLLSSL
jgi:hypothetical protein